MKMRKLLETYYDTYKVQGYYTEKKAAEIFVNPSVKELNNIIKKSDRSYARFAIIGKKLYVWDYKILHHTVLNKMNKNPNSVGVIAGMLKKDNGKWEFIDSNFLYLSIDLKNKRYLKSIVNKDYKWANKYVKFTPKWNEYKREIEKVI